MTVELRYEVAQMARERLPVCWPPTYQGQDVTKMDSGALAAAYDELAPRDKNWYRIEDYSVSGGYTDVTGDYVPGPSYPEFRILKFPVLSVTKCGAWLEMLQPVWPYQWAPSTPKAQRRWCSSTATRRFACPTLAEALESFLHRKRKQASIYRARADLADRSAQVAFNRWGQLLTNTADPATVKLVSKLKEGKLW